MPWASGKSPLTQAYAWFLARRARRPSWKEAARVFRASWEKGLTCIIHEADRRSLAIR